MPALDTRDHAVAVVVDGGQWLIEFVRHARSHLAHGDQPTGVLGALGLGGRLCLGDAARRDVCGDHHLRQPAIDPTQVTRANFQPFSKGVEVDLGTLGLAVGKRVGWQTGKDVDIVQRFVRWRRCRHTGFSHQLQMPACLGAEPEAVQLVGKQQFVAAKRRHGNRRVQRFKHRGEALVRGRQLIPNPVRLGDVRHGGHPSALHTMGVDQGRDIESGVKQGSVLALHPKLHTAGQDLACQFFFQPRVQGVAISLRPVRKRCGAAHQIGFAPARHLAKRRIDVGDSPLQIECTHACEHGILHGPAEHRFRHQRLLCLHASARVAPVGDQHPGCHRTQGCHQPEQATADDAERGSIGLAANRQVVANRRHRNFVGVYRAVPRQQAGGRVACRNRRAGQQAAPGVVH